MTEAAARLRIVHVGCVLDPERRSGAELLRAWPTLGDVATAVQTAGAEVSIVHAAHRDELVLHGDVRCRFVAEPRLLRPGGARRSAAVLPVRLARAVAALRPDVIHVNGLGFPLHVALLAHLPGRPPVLVQDHADRPHARLRWLSRPALRAAAAVSFTAREQAEPFLEAGFLPADVRVLEIPESSTRFTPGDRDAARAVTGIHGDPAVLWIGHLDANKDPLTILNAVALALEHLPKLHLWCCFSTAPLMGAVQVLLESNPTLRERVHLLGALPHERMELACRASDFLMSGSHREGSGYAVIEALACGTTPILSDIPAFRALTGRGLVGALAPPGAHPVFAEQLLRLARADRAMLRARAREHFERSLTFPVLGARLLGAYRELLADRQRSGKRSAAS